MDKIAVLIPCYNEAATIKKVVAELQESMPEAVIYVYDNNSTDDTARLAEEAGAVLRHEYQQGKGNVIRRMFREIDSEVYIMVDGDDTYPADVAPELVAPILEKQADMVVGDRLSSTYFTENKRRFHNFGNDLVRKCVNQIFHSSIQDVMTGYRAFSYQFVKTYPVTSKGFEIETERKMPMENVVIAYRDRPDGSESKLNTCSDGFKVLMTILSLYKNYKPLQFFGSISMVLAFVSIGFFIPVFLDYLKVGLVAKFPTLFMCGFVFLLAMLLFSVGLILQTLRQRDRQDFEFK